MTTSSRILSPIGADNFLANYWEKLPLHISRESAKHFADVLTEQMLLDELAKNQALFPNVQLTQSDRSLTPESYTDKNQTVLFERVAHLRSEGATLVWSQAHDYFSGLYDLCRELQAALKLPCLANVYLSPSTKQGFNAHYDSHDVCIVQLSGRKTFRFYEDGVTLPFHNERFNKDVHQAGKLSEEIELLPGDTLYIPRGMMHDAIATGDEPSLHITIGIYTITYKDLLQQQLELKTLKYMGLRRSVNALTHHNESVSIPEDVLAALPADNELVARAFSQLQDELALDALPDPDLHTISEPSDSQLHGGAQLMVRADNVMNLSRDEDTITLRLLGKTILLNDPLGAAVQWLLAQSSGKFTIDSIPSLSQEQSLALCKQLILENVLVLID